MNYIKLRLLAPSINFSFLNIFSDRFLMDLTHGIILIYMHLFLASIMNDRQLMVKNHPVLVLQSFHFYFSSHEYMIYFQPLLHILKVILLKILQMFKQL